MTDPEPAYRDPGPPPPIPPRAPVPAPTAPPYGDGAAPPYAAPYVPARHPQYAAAVAHATPSAGTLGVVALVLAVAALVLPALVAGFAGYGVGVVTGSEFADGQVGADWDWSLLSPARNLVLLGEIAFWTGTILGTWALIQGIVAIVTRRGRRPGIVAVALAVLASGVFAVVTWFAVLGGMASGASTLVA